jgi:iron complex outermembrane receptor protein
MGRFGFNLNGTYIINWEEQLDGVNNVSGLGAIVDPYTVGAIPRWRHYATLTWTSDRWGATLTQNYTLGYTDEARNPAGNLRRVGSYELWNVQGTCKCFDNTSIVLGVKNVFDRAPPFSNTIAFMQTGYNPQYADPRGRIYYGSMTLAFK